MEIKTIRSRRNCSGMITLEFLIVIAVIGVFGGLFLIGGKKLLDKAHTTADTLRLQFLAEAYMSSKLDLSGTKTMVEFAVALAEAGGPNDISAYQSGKRRNGGNKDILINGETNPDLKEEDFDFIFMHPIFDHGDQTPLFCTRGLQKDGTWHSDSLYGSKGGLVVFADLNVRSLVRYREEGGYQIKSKVVAKKPLNNIADMYDWGDFWGNGEPKITSENSMNKTGI